MGFLSWGGSSRKFPYYVFYCSLDSIGDGIATEGDEDATSTASKYTLSTHFAILLPQ